MRKKKKHSVRFLNLVDDARVRVQEIPVETVLRRFKKGETLHVIDVREYKEYLGGHMERCRHISKGILERDVENFYPHLDQEIILYCQGGYRSILAADALQKMGYSNVYSMTGGWRAWKEHSGPISLL